MSFTIAAETPLQDEVRALVAALNEWALTQTPREFTHHMTVEQMAQPDTTVFVARDEAGVAAGIGALKRHPGGVGEVKRMFATPQARGSGVGAAIVASIEDAAAREGIKRLVLETGATPGFAAAWRLYERRGFTRCGAVLDYPPDTGHNIFYEKFLIKDALRA
ncbi:MAG: GNAT family N-acetyltransferase [Hyphomonadaceae bacterium]